jgi:protein-tyrosine phosphatase
MFKIRRSLSFVFLLLALSASPFALPAGQAVQQKHVAKTHERQIKLEGQDNFRDVGGYRTADGHTVKWGLIYRAGQLSKLTDADLSKLKELNIRTVIDFRGTSEIETRGKDRLPEGVRNVSLPIDINSLPKPENEEASSASSTNSADSGMLRATRSIMLFKTDVYSAFIRELSNSRNRPLLFHCTAGKDRTGVGGAILLTLLGVPWETVKEDYLLSNVYRREQNEKDLKAMRDDLAKKQNVPLEKVDVSSYEAMYYVKPEYIEAARQDVINKYGSMGAFFKKELGVTDDLIKRLRAELLE